MTAYLLIMLMTTLIAYVAVRIYRTFSGSGMLVTSTVSDKRVLTLSPADGQWRLKHQMGFVRPDRRAPRSRTTKSVKNAAPRKVSSSAKPTIRKPWGW